MGFRSIARARVENDCRPSPTSTASPGRPSAKKPSIDPLRSIMVWRIQTNAAKSAPLVQRWTRWSKTLRSRAGSNARTNAAGDGPITFSMPAMELITLWTRPNARAEATNATTSRSSLRSNRCANQTGSLTECWALNPSYSWSSATRSELSEGRDRDMGRAQRALFRRIVGRRLVLDQRHVGHTEADGRLAPIDDLHGPDDSAAGTRHEIVALLERRAGVAHVVDDQHALALHPGRIERAENRMAVVIRKRRERVRRVRHRPAAVEQPRNGVREQRAAGGRAGHDFGLLDELGRHHIDQILRDTPDRRRPLEQLVRIQVQLAVKAVAVIKVAFHHHL